MISTPFQLTPTESVTWARYLREEAHGYLSVRPEKIGDLPITPERPVYVSRKYDGKPVLVRICEPEYEEDNLGAAHVRRQGVYVFDQDDSLLQALDLRPELVSEIPHAHHGDPQFAVDMPDPDWRPLPEGLFVAEAIASDGHGGRERVQYLTGAKDPGYVVFDDLGSYLLGWGGMSRTDEITVDPWPEDEQISTVTWYEATSPAEVAARYAEIVVAGGAEGIVVRGEQRTWKVKPDLHVDVLVLGYEMVDGQFRSVLVGVCRGSGVQIVGHVGSGEGLRDLVLEDDTECPRLPMPTGRGTVYRWCLPVVLEVRCTDLVPSTHPHLGLGVPTTLQPAVSMLHPVAVRVRTDTGIPMWAHQIERVVGPIPMKVEGPEPAFGVVTEITATKGDSWRRCLVVRRPEPGPEYREWTVIATDYSPGRANPCTHKVQAFVDKAEVDLALDEWRKANVKRGWEVTP